VSWIGCELWNGADDGFRFQGLIRDWVLTLDWASTRDMDQMEDSLNTSGELARIHS
jgi:hypothetical protein